MAGDIFIKIGDIKGESQADGHKDEIELMSWSWGATQSGSTQSLTGSTAGKVNVHDLTFTKLVDVATPNLVKAVCGGTAYKEALLVCQKSAGNGKPKVPYLKIKLGNVLISSYSTGGAGGSDETTETISLNFGKVELTYTQQTPEGTAGKAVPMAWNIPAGNEKWG
jgi:type VI secretion system secreted protein Hcp